MTNKQRRQRNEERRFRAERKQRVLSPQEQKYRADQRRKIRASFHPTAPYYDPFVSVGGRPATAGKPGGHVPPAESAQPLTIVSTQTV